MSINSNQLSVHPELIGRNVNGFSFTQELINNVNNFDFKKSAYQALSAENDTEESYIWTALSNIVETITSYDETAYKDNDNETPNHVITENTPAILYQNIAESFEDHILNYIDNVSNIDICKIKSLQSMIQQLGINYTLFDKLKLMPIQILNLIDILSIKKEYLINDKKLKPLFTKLLQSEVSSLDGVEEASLQNTVSALTETRLSSVISADTEVYPLSNLLDTISVDYSSYIDNDKLYNFTSALYKIVLSNFCNLRYNNSTNKIFVALSDNIELSNFTLENTNEEEISKLNAFRLKYNIDKDFNSSNELDSVENGLSSFQDYTIHEQYLLSSELAYRQQPLSSSALYSRYYYYRQRVVRDFFKFVEHEYANYLSLYLSTDQYNIDNSYLVVNNDKEISLVDRGLNLNETMIDSVAKVLVDITEAIRDIREQVKTQVQKNFLKGTKLHLEYIIKEYIKNNIYPVYHKLAYELSADSGISAEIDIEQYDSNDVILKINEYADPTEYFNISTDIDELSDNVNLRFWQNNITIHGIKPFNSNNLFKKPEIIHSTTKQNFLDSDIQYFYKQNLQTQFASLETLSSDNEYEQNQNNQLCAFLDAVYDSGTDTTYQDADGNICCNLDFANQNNFTTVKRISDLPQIQQQAAINTLIAISSSTFTDIHLDDIIYNQASAIGHLSNLPIDSYNNILSAVQYVLDYTQHTLNGLQLTNISVNFNEKDEQWRKYKNKLFKKYSGLSSSDYSFYNIKNQRHPSYQIHPYIKNFVDTDNIDYPIGNIANIVSEKIVSRLINHISTYVDNDGYLINEWNNTLHTNSDYISEYEHSSNISPIGIVSKQIDYDGLFYPEAVKDFLADTRAFTSTLRGLSDDNYKCTNKWYKDLNLSYNERNRICEQLAALSSVISSYAVLSAYDIHRYGKDYYGNMYILVKDYGKSAISDVINISEKTKLNKPGIMWMRIKNHPIAFPMIYKDFNNSDSESKPAKYSQIEYINNKLHNIQSNIKFNDVSAISLLNNTLSCPEIYDFCISKDKTEFFFLANDKKYVIHANIKKIYYPNEPDQRFKHYLILDNFNNNIKGVDSDTGFSIPDDVTFSKFYNFDNYLGIVAISAIKNNNTLSCHVYMPYWNKTKLDGNQLDTRLNTWLSCQNCATDALNDYQIDVTSKKRFSIAYRNNLLNNNINLTDYLGKQIIYPGQNLNTNARLSTLFINSISTKDWKFDSKQFVEVDNSYRVYLPYNEMGFIPAYELNNEDSTVYSSRYINNIYNPAKPKFFTDCLSAKGQLKFNLVGRPKTVSTNDYGIFFKRIIPARMHEQYSMSSITAILPASLTSNISAVNFVNARYTEMLSNIYTTKNAIYDPYEFEQNIHTSDLSIRLDESYMNVFDNNQTLVDLYPNLYKQTSDGSKQSLRNHLNQFKDTYYLWKVNTTTSYTDYKELYNPGASGQSIKANNQDQYIIKLSADLSADQSKNQEDVISVSWIRASDNKYGLNAGIKLDFNTAYYNNNTSMNDNYFNWKHSFLNLDKPGDFGYLQIWHNDEANGNKPIIPGNIYVIKNISDNKPKFLISLLNSNISSMAEYTNEHDLLTDKYENTTISISGVDALIEIGLNGINRTLAINVL